MISLFLGWWLMAPAVTALPPFVCTEGGKLVLVSSAGKRELAPGFAASRDADISFDARRVLFSGKPTENAGWSVWEVPVSGGKPRKITDGIRPLYLPDERIAYARRAADGYQIEALGPGGALRLTFAPGDHLPATVLRDGRILFEHAGELYAVYTDGSGVESYRCDHGTPRHGARQLSSGDIVFATRNGLARFTSALAKQAPVPAPRGEYSGVAELPGGDWLVGYRKEAAGAFAIYRWTPGKPGLREIAANAEQPVLVAPRQVPPRHPSGLHGGPGANLLCLNVYTSKLKIAPGSVSKIRVYGRSGALGEAPVEPDGSFFVQVPSDTPIRFELRDKADRILAAERGWFWARTGEQRVCVGCHAGPERAPENAVPRVLLRADVPMRMGKLP